ncbi:MAG TPA: hypothetical protein PK926_05820 [Spirochaetota bacterium]|nr:hypothetical protein [Spirochaetota bacterium]HPI87719.1 hypothetical protein [Spirochaetota bacterium]HPR48156.1 hypothetical protein [Spirochaetota bacterium]
MKTRFVVFFIALFVTLIVYTNNAFSQSVFLKDGSIVEGTILTENDNFLTIKSNSGKKNIKRSEIIRTVYNNDYKTRVNVVLMDGRIIKGYVVEEGKNYYIVRKYLSSTKELRLNKKKINGILKDESAIKKDEPEDNTAAESSDPSEFPGLDVRTDKKVYAPNEKIVVYYSNMPGGRYDWISLAKKDSPDDNYELYYYTNRGVEGELNFKKGLPQGEYEVRVYLHWAQGSYKVSKRYFFRVK